jgi:hypothetical protein
MTQGYNPSDLCHQHLPLNLPKYNNPYVSKSISTVGWEAYANGGNRVDWPGLGSTGDAAMAKAGPFTPNTLPLPLPCRDPFFTAIEKDSRIYLVFEIFRERMQVDEACLAGGSSSSTKDENGHDREEGQQSNGTVDSRKIVKSGCGGDLLHGERNGLAVSPISHR